MAYTWPNGKRPAAAEVGVVVALQVVAVARFAVEEPEEGHGDAHTWEHTLRVYLLSIEEAIGATSPGSSPGRCWKAMRQTPGRACLQGPRPARGREELLASPDASATHATATRSPRCGDTSSLR